MDLWILFLILAAACAAVGSFQFKTRSAWGSAPRQSDPISFGSSSPIPFSINIPTAWTEADVTKQLRIIGDRPELVTYYIESLKKRFILSTEDRTAQLRTRFIRTQIEQLSLSKEYQGLISDLRALETEQTNRLLRLTLEQRGLQVELQRAETLTSLRLQKEQLAIEVEIKELKVKKQKLGQPEPASPALAEAKLSPEQQRRLKRMEIEDRIEQLERLEGLDVQKSRDDEDRIRIENMYADKREELREQLVKYLV